MANPGEEFINRAPLPEYSTDALRPGARLHIVPVEAQACGRPVIALARGGTRETVLDGETGVLVEESSAAAFADGVRRLEQVAIDPGRVRAHAVQFSRARFLEQFMQQVTDLLSAPAGQVRW